MEEAALLSQIKRLTVPSSDNGRRFVRTDRLERVEDALSASTYGCVASPPLARVYRRKDFRENQRALLVSCHIDSVYGHYWVSTTSEEVIGTLDNSACNGILVELMVQERLPAQAMVVFTGDEEGDSAGVDQVISCLHDTPAVFWNLELVIALDLTEEFYGQRHFTIENCFVERDNARSLLKFGRKRELRRYLTAIAPGAVPVFVKDAEADESWQYDEHDVNCFSLCLPCRLLGSDMHDDSGVAVSRNSLMGYAETLAALTAGIDADLTSRTAALP